MATPENQMIGAKYGQLRAFFDCQATLYGTTTMANGFAAGFVQELPVSNKIYPREDFAALIDSSVTDYIISIDPVGSLRWTSQYIEKKGRPKAHVIEVLTEQVSDDYLDYLQSFGISYIFAGRKQLDCSLALQKLKKQFQIHRLMAAGGGQINASLLQAGLIDELSLVLSPLVDGGKAASIFDWPDLPNQAPNQSLLRPVAFQFIEAKPLEDHGLWLRYSVKQESKKE